MADFNSFDDLLQDSTQDGGSTQPTEPPQGAVEPNKDDDSLDIDQNELNGGEGSSQEPPTYPDNSIYRFLQERGVSDPSKIKFTNEDNTEEEVDFNSLSADDQLEILKQVTDPGLSTDEIRAVNYMRQNNANLEQIIDYWAQKKLDSYLNEHPEAVHQKTYTVDDYTDDDLFVIDLKQRYPDFTDEELVSELESAKTNEELFKKKAEILRNTYKANEDKEIAAQKQAEEQQVEDLRANLKQAASQFNEVQLDYTDDKSDSLVIDDEDKQQMMSYILDQDADGKSQLIRDLEDPNRLIEMAWFSTQGPKMLSELTKYWKGLLANERAENKKLQSKIDKLSKTTTTVVTPTDKKEIKSGNSLWDNTGLI